MSLPVGKNTHPTDPISTDFGGEHRAKSVPPKPHGFVTDGDTAPVQRILDVSERKGKANVGHDRQAIDLRAAVKVFEWIPFGHGWMLRNRPAGLKPICSDIDAKKAA